MLDAVEVVVVDVVIVVDFYVVDIFKNNVTE